MKVLDRYKEPVRNIAREKSGNYTGAELKPYTGRPGSEDALALPSRVGPRLCHRDGRVTDIAGKPLTRSNA